MSSTQSSTRLLDAILSVLWQQWTTLGVAGTRCAASSIIDPEALVLATSRFGRYEPRLFDEMLDWLTQHSGILDVTRLKRMATTASVADARVLSALIDYLQVHAAASKWASIAQALVVAEDSPAYGGRQSLFLDSAGTPQPTFGATDDFFAQHGFDRPPVTLRGMSQEPRLVDPALVRLRLRALMGPGVRAETVLYLSTHDHAHGRLIATRSAYSQRQVSEYLAQLADAGFAERWDAGRTVQYRLSVPLAATDEQLPCYVDWLGVWSASVTLWSAAEAARAAATPYAAAKAWRTGLVELRKALPAEGLGVVTPVPEHYPGESLTAHAEEYVSTFAVALAGVGS
jgi:hypothetical protein